LIQEELEYICKTQIDVQSLIDVQSSNPCPISMSQTSVPFFQIDVKLCHYSVIYQNNFQWFLILQ
jgi:hypothetical protein